MPVNLENIEKQLEKWLAPMGKLPELYLVGGAVRDLVLGRACQDIDLICDDAKTFARKVADKNGAAFVPFEKKEGEPCFRVVDRRDASFLDFANIRGESLSDDLALRDFTINAMAARIETGGKIGGITDPMGGMGDLKRETIKNCGPKAFANDPLRIMRAYRFAALLGYEIDDGCIVDIRAHADRLPSVSPERILAELFKIFSVEKSASRIRMMDDHGILERVLPEIRPMKGCEQNGYHHLDVWEHSLLVLEKAEDALARLEHYFGPAWPKALEKLETDNNVPLLKMAAILHDVGKPSCKKFDEKRGRATFHGHEAAGAKIAAEAALRLRMPKKDGQLLADLVGEHLHVLSLTRPEVKPSTKMRWFKRFKDDCIPVILLAMADAQSKRGPLSDKAETLTKLERLKAMAIDYYDRIKAKNEQPSLIDGNDILQMGVSRGPVVGRTLKTVEDALEDGEISGREEALRMARRLIESEKKNLPFAKEASSE